MAILSKTLKKAKEEMEGVKIQLKEDETDIICEKCGRRMVIKTGRYGKFHRLPRLPGVQKYQKACARKTARNARSAAARLW